MGNTGFSPATPVVCIRPDGVSHKNTSISRDWDVRILRHKCIEKNRRNPGVPKGGNHRITDGNINRYLIQCPGSGVLAQLLLYME